MGDSDVGKSSILKRFMEDSWSEEKPANQGKGVYVNKEFTVDGQTVKFEMVDLAFDVEATASDFSGAKGCLAVFDYSNPDSIENVRNYLGIANRFVSDDNFFKCIVGNKCDAEKKIDDNKVQSLSNSLNVPKVYSCSAKTGEGIKEMFDDIAKSFIGGSTTKDKKGDKKDKPKKEKKGSCVML